MRPTVRCTAKKEDAKRSAGRDPEARAAVPREGQDKSRAYPKKPTRENLSVGSILKGLHMTQADKLQVEVYWETCCV